MADLHFFFDPVCPWAWVTSRWVEEVRSLRPFEVEWKFISLKMLNEARPADSYPADLRVAHVAGLHLHRVCAAVRSGHGNEGVGRLYTALGSAIHVDGRRDAIADPATFLEEMLTTAGLPGELAEHWRDESHDGPIREETELALSRAGRDLGTPILTFHPGADDEGSFFGPIISRAPRGAEALRLWDAVEVVATTPGVAELKRNNRSPLRFD